MGGKTKQSQRTKNNVKPSSSARSAEILGNSVPNFVGFSAVKDGTFVPFLPGFTVPTNETIEANLGTEFQLTLKKLGKKDSTTKLKALQEFSALIENSSLEKVNNALPLWPRLYTTLATDIEHKVREAAQVAHGVVVKKCGRSIAPYIKQIAPAWITSQYDNFAPAATQAQLSLQTIFPEKKLPDVLSFCKNELMIYIHENLVLHTANTIANPKSSTPEAAEMKYQRLVIASLQGYALIIKHLPDCDIEWMCEEQSKILESNKFWKYASNKIEHIRSSWFALVGQLCTRIPTWFAEKYGTKTAKILIANLNEKNSGISMSIWDSFVLFIANIKDCSITEDMTNDLKRKMFEALKFGGWGIASQLSTLLLPIVAHLPPAMLTSEFYSEFFTSLLIGLEEKNVLSSKSERQAWITGLVECLRYVSRNNIDTFACQVLPPQMRCLLLQILNLPNNITKSSVIKYTGQQLSCLISYWIKQSAETTQDNYDRLIRLFWQNANSILVLQIETAEPDIEKLKDITDNHLQLIIALKNGSIVESKKRTKVQFDEPDCSNRNVDTPKNTVDKTSLDRYTHNLNQLVYEICAQYLQYASVKEVSAPILGPLSSLILEFNNKVLFDGISQKMFKASGDCSIVTLYDKLWKKWLTSDSMRSQAVVELTFILLIHLEEEEQEQVLKSFSQFVPSVLEMCISKCISHPYSTYKSVKNWMQSSLVTQTLSSICQRLVKQGDQRSKTLIKMCFSLDIDGNTMISEDATCSILSILVGCLGDTQSEHLDMCASFVSQLVTTVNGVDQFNFKDLLVEMVKLNCTVKPNNNISADTWWEVKTSWQDAISSLAAEPRDSFMKESAVLLYNAVTVITEEADLEGIDLTVGLAAGLTSGLVSQQNSLDDNTLIAANMAKTFLNFHDICEKFEHEKLYKSALKSHILLGDLNCPLSDGNKALQSIVNESSETIFEVLNTESMSGLISWYLWVAKYLRTVLSRSEIMYPVGAYKDLDRHSLTTEEEDDNEITEENAAWISGLIHHQHVAEQLATLIHNLMIVKSLYTTWTFSENFTKLSKYVELESNVEDIIKLLPDSYVTLLYNKACSEGYFWSIAYQYYSNLKNVEHKTDLKDEGNIFLSGTGYFHNLQAYSLTKVNKEVDTEIAFVTNSKLALRCFHIANCSETSEDKMEITEEDIQKCITDKYGCLTLILTKYYAKNSIMLYERDITSAPWPVVVSNASTVRLLSAAVAHGGWELDDLHWDFITITLSSLFCSLQQSLTNWKSTKVVILLNALVELYSVVSKFVGSVNCRSVQQQPGRAVAALPQEWRDIFAPDLHTNIFKIISHVFADGVKSAEKLDLNLVIFLSSLESVVKLCDYSHIPAALRSGHLSLDAILRHCLQVLNAPYSHTWKYCSYTIVNQIIPNLVQVDDDNLSLVAESDTGTVMPKLTLHKLEWVLNNLQENVDAILDPYVMLEDSCELMPFTDSYNIVLGYLLLWELSFNVYETAKGDLHNQFVHMLRNSEHFDGLLTNMVKLMPPSVTQQIPGKHIVCSQAQEHFQTMPTLNSQVAPSAGLLARFACRVWARAVCGAGVAGRVRGWWAGLEARAGRNVERIVTDYVSAALILTQLQHVLASQHLLEDVQINVHYPNSEIVCTHQVDGRNLVLTIQLPKNHPLGTPKIDITGSPVNSTQGIAFLFTYHNGSLWLAIEIWLSSLQRKLRTVPVCYVCYCRLHHSTGTLPNVYCGTCKNKFHNPCIFKWFATSGKSTCPLCRSSF